VDGRLHRPAGRLAVHRPAEDVTKVRIGDYIVRGTNGEFYPVDPATFEFKYEEIR
jgi:hypothetical protein